ncbi:MAG TPA: adenosine deaminase [Gemmatimonadales bacterium]|nr:adenosine deaminase [Gemmatimonadales bacterium]
MPDRAWFRRLPKAELHVHLDGSLRPATLLELARATRVELPATTPEAVRRAFRVDDARNLADYLKRFDTTVAVLQTPEALTRVAREMVIDADADGVRYLEVRYCPVLSTAGGLSLDEVITAIARGLGEGAVECGTTTGIICCTLRHLDPGISDAIAEAAVRHRRLGVVGFDIAGGEATHPAKPHRHAFEIAARGHLGITVHAGEAAGPESVAEALFDCRANRIGHGTRLGEDPDLLAYVRDREIPIEINLTSNLQTRVVPDARHHPLRRYLDAGLTLVLSSDNWLMSDVTLSSEYALAGRAAKLTRREIEGLVRNGFHAAFAPRPVREAIAEEARARLEVM